MTGTKNDWGIGSPPGGYAPSYFGAGGGANGEIAGGGYGAADGAAQDVKDAIDDSLCGEGGTAASNLDEAANQLYPGGSAAELQQLTQNLLRAVQLTESQYGIWNSGGGTGYGSRGGNRTYGREDVETRINFRRKILVPWEHHFYLWAGTHNRTNIFPNLHPIDPNTLAVVIRPHYNRQSSFAERVAEQSAKYNQLANDYRVSVVVAGGDNICVYTRGG